MNQKKGLNGYLIKYFLLLLLLVGVAEFFLNLIYRDFTAPWLKSIFGFEFFSMDTNLSESLSVFALCIFWFAISSFTKQIPGGVSYVIQDYAAKRLQAKFSTGFLFHANSLATYHSSFYIAGLICTFLLLFLVWLLPYIVAAVSFSVIVSKKSASIDAEEKKKQTEYERQRNLLLSDIAHDLKTPMTTVAGYASALSNGDITDPEKEKEYLDAIYRKSMQMKDLLQLLFEYVKLDSEGFYLKKEKTDLTELLRETIADVYTDLEDAGMELTFDIPDDPIPLDVDRIQLSRAIHNLFVNSWKHNPAGTHIHVSITSNSNFITLTVSDTGSKIPEDTALHLFEPFVQGDTSRTGGKGSGLGLSITKKIISLHDGDIALIQPGNDSYVKTFEIRLKNTMAEY